MAEKVKQTGKWYEKLISWILPLLFILIWYIWTAVLHPGTVLPTPADIIKKAFSMISTGQLGEYAWITFKHGLTGFLTGGIPGVLLGFFNGLFRLPDITLNRTIHILKAVPVLAPALFILLWFGPVVKVKIIMIAAAVFFPVYISTYQGIKSICKGFFDMGKMYGFGRYKIFREIILPGVLPCLFPGIRYALNTMWLVLIAIDIIAPDKGVGFMAASAVNRLQLDQLILSIILYALLAKISEIIIGLFERNLLSWKMVQFNGVK